MCSCSICGSSVVCISGVMVGVSGSCGVGVVVGSICDASCWVYVTLRGGSGCVSGLSSVLGLGVVLGVIVSCWINVTLRGSSDYVSELSSSFGCSSYRIRKYRPNLYKCFGIFFDIVVYWYIRVPVVMYLFWNLVPG